MTEFIEKIEDKIDQIEKSDLVKDISGQIKNVKKQPKWKTVLVLVVLIAAGIGTGYLLSSREAGPAPTARNVGEEEVTKGMTVGIADEKTFKDSAEGKVVKGGLDGEGSHHLERPGGDSQSVYLTSSIVDLDKFVGREVQVWGETFSAKKAGWLMDVGKVKVLN